MQLNVFRVPQDQTNLLRARLKEVGLSPIKTVEQDGWTGDFLFSDSPKSKPIPWIETFSDYFGDNKYYNRSYFAVFLFEKGPECFALSFGKSHFYVRPYCDYDFGIELAKRIADIADVSQTSAKRFQGKQRKDIRSFSSNARLSVPPGESVEFLQGTVISEKRDDFGGSGKFGASALLTPVIEPQGIGGFLSRLVEELGKPERFQLPRTMMLSDKEEIKRFDKLLLDELQAPIGTSELATHTYDLFGVDFIFSSTGSFTLKCGHYKSVDLEQLTMRDVKEYIADRSIPRDKLLQIKIITHREDAPDVEQRIKEAVDFISDGDRVALTGGKWLQFNQDYLDYLDEAVREIAVECTEPEYEKIELREGEFNASLASAGYEVADKNFSIFKTRSPTPVEAWDLARHGTVYAVKFGTAQKLHYACDQAMLVLDLLHNRAEAKEIPHFDRYCLWLGYQATELPKSIADSGSIILKQKIEAWSRRCSDLGVEPVLKLSLKVKPGVAEAGDATGQQP